MELKFNRLKLWGKKIKYEQNMFGWMDSPTQKLRSKTKVLDTAIKSKDLRYGALMDQTNQ